MSRRNEGRFPMSLRVSPETYKRIADAAAASGRSLAQEMETRLEASFHDEDAMRVIRETIRQEMRAEFAGREAARKAAREAERERLMKSATIYGGANQGQQWAAAAINQFSGQDWMALKTEPEKA